MIVKSVKKCCFWFTFFTLFYSIQGCDSARTRKNRFFLQANEQLKNRSFDEAIRFYDAAIQIDPSFSDAWNNRGIALYENNQFSEAVASFGKAIELKSQEPKYLLNRSNAQYRLKQFYNALADLHAAEKFLPDTAVIPFLKGTVYFELGEYDSALYHFNKALLKDSLNPETWVNIGSTWLYKNELDKSAEAAQKALELSPRNPDAENVLALGLLESGLKSQALALLNAAIIGNSKNAYFYNNRGLVFLEMDSLEAALKDINKSIEMDPYNGWAYRNKGIFYLKKHEFENALRVLDETIKLNDKIKLVYFYRGRVLESLDKPGEACYSYRISMDRGENKGKMAYESFCLKKVHSLRKP
jgi:tetratricopeptide (TPR) repeat protein